MLALIISTRDKMKFSFLLRYHTFQRSILKKATIRTIGIYKQRIPEINNIRLKYLKNEKTDQTHHVLCSYICYISFCLSLIRNETLAFERISTLHAK